MEISSAAIFGIFFGFIFVFVLFLSEGFSLKRIFPYKFNELKTDEKLIKKIKGNISIGQYFWFSVTLGWFIDVYIYEKSIAVKYFGQAFRYEYNKENMYFTSYFLGIIPYFVIETEKTNIWLFLWFEERNLLQSLIDKNSK